MKSQLMSEQQGFSARIGLFLKERARLIFSSALVGSVLLGLWGYVELQAQAPDWRWTLWGVLDAVYSTLRLFVLEAAADTDSSTWPWQVQLARFLAPLSLAGAGIQAVMTLLQGARWKRRMSRLHDHVVVLGAASAGLQLVTECLGKHRKQQVVHVHGPGARADVGGEEGRYYPIEGDAFEARMLQLARVEFAERVIVMTESDHKNIRVAKALAGRLKDREASTATSRVDCFLEMSADVGSPLYRGEAVNHLSTDRLAVHLFNPVRVAARELVRWHPPHVGGCPASGHRPMHVLVVGFESLGREVVKQLIRVCHYLDHNKVQITIVAEKAQRAYRRFLKEVPALDQVADVIFHDADPASITNQVWNQLQSPEQDPPRGAFHAAYITTSDSGDAFAVAMDARDGLGNAPELRTNRADIVLCGNNTFLDNQGEGAVTVFDPQKRVWTTGYLLQGYADKIAMGIHDGYLASRQGSKDFRKKPADREWEVLPENLRDANRDQADHVAVKTVMFGVSEEAILAHASHVESLTKADNKREFTKFAKLHGIPLEELAEVEHRRWMASKALAGFTYGKPRDDKLRHHDDMIPYEDLDDGIQEYDRDVIREFPERLRLARKSDASH